MASQILFLAARGFNASDCLGSSKSQIPGNACQVECSSPKIQQLRCCSICETLELRERGKAPPTKHRCPTGMEARSTVWPS
jgi:hypothetical protein